MDSLSCFSRAKEGGALAYLSCIGKTLAGGPNRFQNAKLVYENTTTQPPITQITHETHTMAARPTIADRLAADDNSATDFMDALSVSLKEPVSARASARTHAGAHSCPRARALSILSMPARVQLLTRWRSFRGT